MKGELMDEATLLQTARDYAFRARLDGADFDGPVLESASGSIVRDVQGKEYLDFNSGQMCSALGHSHPKIAEAIKDSADRFVHASSTLFNVKEIELSGRIGEIVDRPLQKSFFLLSGSDANEAALAMAKKATGGYEVASPHTSFHGLGDTTRAVTFGSPAWHKGYAPPAPGNFAIFAPYCYRCPLKLEYPSCDIQCLDAGFELLDAETSGQPAAIITEPLFSAGGVIEAPRGWLPKLKELCDERGTLLVLDECQTGLAKLGSMWAYQDHGVVPDILTTSKHFGGGITISAVVTSPEIEERVVSQGFIYSHSHVSDPLACNAAIASLDVIRDERLTERAREIDEIWKACMRELAERHELIGDIRGRGLIQGIEFVLDRERRTPAFPGEQLSDLCLERGLILSVRRRGSVLRFVPPFTTSVAQLRRAAEILDEAFSIVGR
jgi:2,2-dialkylglycine decarboxylase (pyruvate)